MSPTTTATRCTAGAPSSRWQASAHSPQRQPNVQFFSFPWQGGSCAAARMTHYSGDFEMPSPLAWHGHRCGRRGRRGARRELVFRVHSVAGETAQPHRFPAQLCEQDFDAYECSVISDDTMQAVGAGILDESSSPRSPEPRR